jgi:hypothetical protein
VLNPLPEDHITNFILIKYRKTVSDVPSHVGIAPSLTEWNDRQEQLFRTMLEQLRILYPKATVHVLTNERNRDTKRIVWHYKPHLAENHSAKLHLYGLLQSPAMYLDTDIILVRPFDKKHILTKYPFNLYQLSHIGRDLQRLTSHKLEYQIDNQFNCGIIWIARPSKLIVEEMKIIKKSYFNDKQKVEGAGAWFNNDEHPVSYFIAKYDLKMKLFDEVNTFRRNINKRDIFSKQSIHYTGLRKKDLFDEEYKELKLKVKK